MKKSDSTGMDRLDIKILRELQNDGRATISTIAARVGLSTSPCHERIRKLEKAGVIRGYVALLDPKKLNAELLVFVQIRLERKSSDIFRKFKLAAQKLSEIQECFLVSGNFDYLIKARFATMAEYREFLGETLLTLPGVQESTSFMVMEEIKERGGIPLKLDAV